MARTRRPLIAGNWKMFKTIGETSAFFDALIPLIQNVEHCDIVVEPPFTALAVTVEAAEGEKSILRRLFEDRERPIRESFSSPCFAAILFCILAALCAKSATDT